MSGKDLIVVCGADVGLDAASDTWQQRYARAAMRANKYEAEVKRLRALVNQATNFFTNISMSPSADEGDDIDGWLVLARAALAVKTSE